MVLGPTTLVAAHHRVTVGAPGARPRERGGAPLGGADLYDKHEAEGRVATRGILFDVDSDRIRPESTPTLEEIAEMLRSHADLRISIEGHTDATGDDAYSQSLSERRAESVRRALIDRYGIAEDRLEAKGLGETVPVDSNDTAEGRQNNRRVELVKLGTTP